MLYVYTVNNNSSLFLSADEWKYAFCRETLAICHSYKERGSERGGAVETRFLQLTRKQEVGLHYFYTS